MSTQKEKRVVITIDTSNNELISVSLQIDGSTFREQETMTREKAQVVLPLLLELLKEHDVTFADVEAIEVSSGPGSFTGLRVGASIANTLATVLKVPVNGKPLGELVEPIYQ